MKGITGMLFKRHGYVEALGFLSDTEWEKRDALNVLRRLVRNRFVCSEDRLQMNCRAARYVGT
jgi:hypothetical protein